MINVNKPIVCPLSKTDLKYLIKRFGLQAWMFDHRLLVFQWEGLEYEFYVYDDAIFLEKINVLRNIKVSNLDKFQPVIHTPKHELPDFLQ